MKYDILTFVHATKSYRTHDNKYFAKSDKYGHGLWFTESGLVPCNVNYDLFDISPDLEKMKIALNILNKLI